MPKKINVVNLSHIKDAEESHNETNNDEQQLNEIKEEIAKEEESKPIQVVEEDKPLEEAIKEEDKPLEEVIKVEEAKPKRKVGQPKKPISQRMLMKEKMECPDCHRTISKHCYQ